MSDPAVPSGVERDPERRSMLLGVYGLTLEVFREGKRDVERCLKESGILDLEDGEREFWRRTLFRSFFSWVDLSITQMRAFLITAHLLKHASLTSKEHIALTNSTVRVKDTGDVQVISARQSMKGMLRLTLRLMTEKFTPGFSPDYSDNRWRQFAQAVKARDRITHPKSLDDFRVHDADIESLNEGMLWLSETYLETLRRTGATLGIKSLMAPFNPLGRRPSDK